VSEQFLKQPFKVTNGMIDVPYIAGIGVELDQEKMDRIMTSYK
jgi:L-alanine-DL-glutamate epimerase-like enolase superfamily enzyme